MAGLRNGILQNIENELKIPKEYLEDFSIKNHIIAAYRDMVEGGKPQLLFFIRSSWDKDSIMQNFATILRNTNRRETEEAFEDGAKLLSEQDIALILRNRRTKKVRRFFIKKIRCWK